LWGDASKQVEKQGAGDHDETITIIIMATAYQSMSKALEFRNRSVLYQVGKFHQQSFRLYRGEVSLELTSNLNVPFFQYL
jgi:hypothetical protein